MQNVYITRDNKQIQLTVDEIKAAWAAWDAKLRDEQLDVYKEEVKQTLLKLSKDENELEYKMAAGNAEITSDIRRSIENGCDHDWCFNTSEWGGFMDSYGTAMEALEEKEYK